MYIVINVNLPPIKAIFCLIDTATPYIHTLSLHDALPIFTGGGQGARQPAALGRASAGPTLRVSSVTAGPGDRKSTRLNSSHVAISYAVFCLKKKTCVDVQVPTRTSKQTVKAIVMHCRKDS